MTEEELQRWRRAKEVLNDAGWVFDEFVNKQMAEILMTTKPEDAPRRERLWVRARVATELKATLMSEVEQFEDSKKLADLKEQAREKKNGRRDQHIN